MIVDAEISTGSLTLTKFSPLFNTIQVIPCYLREIARFNSPYCKAIAVVEVEDSYEIAERLYSYHIIVVIGDSKERVKKYFQKHLRFVMRS